MKISISTGMYYTKTYKEILDVIAGTSCNNIELFLNQAFIDVPINELEKEISKRSLNILSIHTPLEFIVFPRRENEDYWINKSIDIAKVFNSSTIVSHMVYGEYFLPAPHGLDEIHKNTILKYKDTDKICIATENLPHFPEGSFLGKPSEFLKFIEQNQIPVTFDTSHCAFGNFPLVETFEGLFKFVKNIHLSDFTQGIEHKTLGTGELPLREFLDYLKRRDYAGTLTIELDFDNKKRNNIESLGQAVEALEKSVVFVKSIIEG